jgi:hypothetical protein
MPALGKDDLGDSRPQGSRSPEGRQEHSDGVCFPMVRRVGGRVEKQEESKIRGGRR